MMANSGNLFAGLPAACVGEEMFADLLRVHGLRVERIVSTGQASPAGFWYDQPEGEWVIVLAGEARLSIEGEAEPRMLKVGDWLNLPPHCRHRVEWTAPDRQTVWLAVHYRNC
jgi:cupin 2 domain-containing protein